MSTSYYLIDEKKKCESDAFYGFWHNQLIPEIKRMLTDYCENANGKYINADLAEDIMDSSTFSQFVNNNQIDLYDDEEKIGTEMYFTFSWNISLTKGESAKTRLANLKKYMDSHPEYKIYDEYHRQISFDDFAEIVRKYSEKINT